MWLYDGKELDTIPYNKYGFVYELAYESGKKYIGKKSFFSQSEHRALVDDKKRQGHAKFLNRNVKKKRTKMELVIKESNWRIYRSSCKDIPKSDKLIAKTVLHLANSKQHLSYLEDKYLFNVDACINDDYYNKNIAGRFYSSVENAVGNHLSYWNIADVDNS